MSEVIYKKCPKCGTAMIREHIVDNTSVPKFIYACPECRTLEIDTYPPRGFISSEIPVSGSIRDWDTPFGPSIAKDIPTESGTQKDLHPNFQDRKFLTEDLNDEIKKFIEEYGYERGEDKLLIAIVARHFAEWQEEQMMNEWLKDRDGCFWDGVEEGKKAMKEQMMKDAVEIITVQGSLTEPEFVKQRVIFLKEG